MDMKETLRQQLMGASEIASNIYSQALELDELIDMLGGDATEEDLALYKERFFCIADTAEQGCELADLAQQTLQEINKNKIVKNIT